MISTEEISLLSFLLTFQGHRTAFADMCAREAAEKGVLLTAELDGKPAGYLCASYDIQSLLITYAYTLPEYRKQGVLTELCAALCKSASSIAVRLSIKSDHEYYAAFEAVCRKLGFRQTDTVMTYSCENKGDARERWEIFMEQHGNGLCGTLERRGYRAFPFSECPREVLEQVYYSCMTDYGNTLDPRPFFDVKAKNMLWDMSFAAVRENKLSAYVLTVGAGASAVIFEHISASKTEIGSGAILLPFCRSMDRFFEIGKGTASYAMYDSNRQAGAFRKKVLSVFATRSSSVYNFCRKTKTDREEQNGKIYT